MNYIDDILINNIFLLFPILVYLFYIASNKNIEKEESDILLSFSMFTSMYLTLCFNIFNYPRINLFMANIIIIISYIWNRPKDSLILSLFYILIVINKYNLNMYLCIIEYIIYYLIYYFKKNKISDYSFLFEYLIIKIISLYLLNNNVYQDNIFITVLIVIISYILIVYFLKKGESIIRYHMSYKELMKEKEIKNTLFKITHEIKNPLAVCKGYFDMLDFNNQEKTEKYIRIIREEVNHALLIINDFSSLSKVTIEKEEIDIDDVIDETLSNLNGLFKEKNIEYEYKGFQVLINADYNRLKQVFINILKNSVEAMEEVKNKLIKINLKENEKILTIEFTDTGIGMDEEVFKNFENPFYTTKTNGTGLGTVLTGEIIKAHNGTIKYFSLINKGTKVIIELPKKSY